MPGRRSLLGQLLAYPVVPDELDDLARVGVLVGRLGQPTDHSLGCGTVSAPFRAHAGAIGLILLTCFLLVAAKTGGAPGGL